MKAGNSQFSRRAAPVALCPTSLAGALLNKEHAADAPKLDNSSVLSLCKAPPYLWCAECNVCPQTWQCGTILITGSLHFGNYSKDLFLLKRQDRLF